MTAAGAADQLVLVLDEVWVRYPGTPADAGVLRGVSLAVAPGEIVGIQGPSGCGKSTLLRICSTLERPTRGRVLVAGRAVPRGWRRDGQVMPINQNATGALDSRWPIWRTITEPLTARHHAAGASRAERRAIAREHLRTVGLDGLDLDTRPGQLSGGQCQRVAILRALVAQPRLLVADEPTAGLDVSVAAGVLHLLADSADRGIAILVASHDRSALQVLCDRVAELRDGALTERPGDRQTARSDGSSPSPALPSRISM